MAMISDKLNKIITAVFGKDVRQALHDGLDAVNKETEETSARQQQLEGTFDQLIINAGNSNAEIVAGRVKQDGTSYETIGKRLDASDSQLEDITNEKGSDILLGSELVDSNGWISDGWTGNFTLGFTHIIGQANTLKRNIGIAGNKYIVEFDVESPTNTGSPDKSVAFTVSIGNSPKFATYRKTGNQHFRFGITALENGILEFVPCHPSSLGTSGSSADTQFDGTIKNISVKEILQGSQTSIVIKKENNVVSENRQTNTDLYNTFLGLGCGKFNDTGDGNTGLGFEALNDNTGGFWNTAIGRQALRENTMGSRNIGIGVYALRDMVSGNRNIGIGTFALEKNTDGRNNIAIGADAMQYGATGENNIAIGLASLGATSGRNSIAIGLMAGADTLSVESLIAIGNYTCRNTTGYSNIGIGEYALTSLTSNAENTAIGYNAMMYQTGGRNIALGSNAGRGIDGLSAGHNNIFIGRNAGYKCQSGDNTIIGFSAGASLTVGAANILIGLNTGATTLVTGSNNILIGNNIDTITSSTSDFFNIGNYIFGTKSRICIGGTVRTPRAYLHLPSSDGTVNSAPLRIDVGTLLSNAENDCLEYDGTNLYFTCSDGIRKKISLISV